MEAGTELVEAGAAEVHVDFAEPQGNVEASPRVTSDKPTSSAATLEAFERIAATEPNPEYRAQALQSAQKARAAARPM